jgi:hypothetical protein
MIIEYMTVSISFVFVLTVIKYNFVFNHNWANWMTTGFYLVLSLRLL